MQALPPGARSCSLKLLRRGTVIEAQVPMLAAQCRMNFFFFFYLLMRCYCEMSKPNFLSTTTSPTS